MAALEMGIGTIESSAGGIGGCPFADRLVGNISTEELVYMLNSLGIQNNVKLDVLNTAIGLIKKEIINSV